MLVSCLKWYVLKVCDALEDSHCVLLSADEVPGSCSHVSRAGTGLVSSATVLQCVPCQLMDRCSQCRLLVGQDVGWEQGQPEDLGGIKEQERPVWDSSWLLARTTGFN